MIVREAIEWISQRKKGCILYTSPARPIRESALKGLAQVAICSKGSQVGPSCECADCYNIKNNSHPHLALLNEENFDEKMRVLYSYPIPVIQIEDVHRLSLNKQTKLLIWLESIGKDRFVMLTSDSEFSVLPTIRSRAVVFTEIPKYRLSEEDEFKVKIFLQNVWTGKEKFEGIATPEDARQMAYNIRQIVVSEIESRLSRPPKKSLPGSDVELFTLLRVVERFTMDPATHNLRLLMSGFTCFVIQGMR